VRLCVSPFPHLPFSPLPSPSPAPLLALTTNALCVLQSGGQSSLALRSQVQSQRPLLQLDALRSRPRRRRLQLSPCRALACGRLSHSACVSHPHTRRGQMGLGRWGRWADPCNLSHTHTQQARRP
jgi:hypothetical protein